MSNTFSEIDKKNRKYCILDNMINIKNLDPNKIKIDKKYTKTILCIIIDKLNAYIEENR